MSDHKQFGHRRGRVEQGNHVHIDRERSVRMVGLAEHTNNKKRTVRSHQKQKFQTEGVSHHKMTLVHQIQQKLSFNKSTGLVTDTGSANQLGHRIFRLQKVMSQIKKQRKLTQRPTTVFVRHKLQPQNARFTHNSHLSTTTHSSRVSLLLQQIQQVREEVKQIHESNEKILCHGLPRKISTKIHSSDYEQFKKYKDTHMFARFPAANFTQPSQSAASSSHRPVKADKQTKQMLIQDFSASPSPIPQKLQDSQRGEKIQQNYLSSNQANLNSVDNNLNYPSQVLYSWKLDDNEPMRNGQGLEGVRAMSQPLSIERSMQNGYSREGYY